MEPTQEAIDTFVGTAHVNLPKVQELLAGDARLLNAKSSFNLLLDHGADVNAGAGGNTALHAAAGFGQPEIAEWLLDKGADANALNYEGKTPLAVAIENGQEKAAELLRRQGGK